MSKVSIFCNNKSCPFDDCERRVDRIRSKVKRDKVTQINMQCICQRYTQFLADQLNKILNR